MATNEFLDIDYMNGHEFEYYCANILRKNGYSNVEVTKGSGDYGIDILAQKDGKRYAIQCKRFRGNVGNKAVQEALSGKVYYNCDVAVVLTNRFFTEQARETARRTNVILWDRNTLLAMIMAANPKDAAFTYGKRNNISKRDSGISPKKRPFRTGCLGLLIIVALIGIIIKTGGQSETTSTEIPAQTNAPEEWIYPTLDDFEYKYENDGITLREYKGSARSIVISESYEVEGHVLPVLKLDRTFKDYTRLVNLIIPEGVVNVQYTTFENNKYAIKHIFLPASMTGSETIFQHFINGEILYYGGTEEQWQKLCYLTHWSDLSFKRVVFNASPADCIDNINTVIPDNNNEKTEPGYAPITDFEFDKYKNEITILNYNGKEKTLRIAPTYIVNDEVCSVVAFGNAFGYGKVETIIIPEGTRSLAKATFNSSWIKTVYLPASLIDVPDSFWGYFHGVDTIYYGGSEEDFKNLCKIDRWSIDVKHMVYNASPNDIPTN